MFRKILSFLLVLCVLLPLPASFAEDGKSERVEPQLLREKDATFVGKRNLVFEPGFQYSHLSSNQLDIQGVSVLPALVIGFFQIEKIRRDILTPSLTMRFGLTDDFEFNIKIPYVLRYDKYTQGVGDSRQTNQVNENDLGDIEGGLLLHLLKEDGSRPGVMASLKVKSRTGKDPYGLPIEDLEGEGDFQIPAELPTGSGHWAIEPALTFVKTADPAVFFGNLSYFNHIKRDTGGDRGTIDPGDSINFSFGLAYALNDKLALSTAFEQKFFTKTKIEGQKIPETDVVVSSLVFGGTYLVAEKRSLTVSVSMGLTEDSPDVQVAIKYPIRFTF